MLICVIFLSIGAGIRCIPLQLNPTNTANENDVFITIAANACGILNGIAGVVTMTAPPAISAIWFPVHVSCIL